LGTDAPGEAALSRLKQLALSCGFTSAGVLKPETFIPRPEVREACAQNKCRSFGKSWSCPPACGSLAECEKIIRKFTGGLLLQTTGNLEDPLDYEGMEKTGTEHKSHLLELQSALGTFFEDGTASCRDAARENPDKPRRSFLLLGAGPCAVCETCAYPGAPCRFPDKKIISMEAMGLVVSEVCKANNIPYYYGANTMTYMSCVLV
jgi:predicted metal-binding protein